MFENPIFFCVWIFGKFNCWLYAVLANFGFSTIKFSDSVQVQHYAESDSTHWRSVSLQEAQLRKVLACTVTYSAKISEKTNIKKNILACKSVAQGDSIHEFKKNVKNLVTLPQCHFNKNYLLANFTLHHIKVWATGGLQIFANPDKFAYYLCKKLKDNKTISL